MAREECGLESGEGGVSWRGGGRLSTIRRADLIAVIQGGTVVEQGSHSHLLALPVLAPLHSLYPL
eukprot:2648914-Rhodomonas_salina.4